jgi:hypothetical protein
MIFPDYNRISTVEHENPTTLQKTIAFYTVQCEFYGILYQNNNFMENIKYHFGTFAWRITAAHMLTYFVAGILAFYIFDYEESFQTGDLAVLMKPTDSPWVMAGSALNIFRGMLFALVLWPFKSVFLETKTGWLKLWLLFLGLAILGTTGPAPGSLEGLIYTNFPPLDQILGLHETVFQTFLFSLLVYYWYRYPKKIWNILSIIFVVLLLLMITAGLLTTYT